MAWAILYTISGFLENRSLAPIFSKIPTSKYLIKIGKNTLLILATQYMLFLGYKLIDKIIFKSDYMDHDSYAISLMLTAVTVLLYVPLAYIVNKYLPIIVGKKRG